MTPSIMTYEEYLRLGRMPTPYFYFIKHGRQNLYYLGCPHCFNPEDSINSVIKHYWKDFLTQIQGDASLSLVEGGIRELRSSEEESILKDGEAGLVTYLSSIQNIECTSPEPGFEHETNTLLNEFSKDEILTYYFIRGVSQWNRLINKPSFEEYSKASLERYKKILNWGEIDFSVEGRVKTFQSLTGREFEATNYKLMTNFCNPTKTDNILNKVSRANSILRDRYIVSAIEKVWDSGKNIFVVYGKTHAIIQEPALKKALEF